jgi:hypothetical protein
MEFFMETIQKHMAVFVLTGRGIETMLAEGGSQAWTIDANRVKECEYVVCIQNHKQGHFSPDQLSAPHHTAFLVGKLAGTSTPDIGNDDKGTRKKLVFSEYAEIDLADKWPGHRNPVFYGTLEDFGINVMELHFQPMPVQPPVEPTMQQPLTIAEAKSGLALTFGVMPSDIEIVIRG